MKKLLIVLLLCGCEQNVSKKLDADRMGHVVINGKDCEIVGINTGNGGAYLYFVDCGPGSSSVTYPVGKTQQTVGIYNCPQDGGK